MNVLELFAGSRSIGNAADLLGYNVFSVDWEHYPGVNLIKDIGRLKLSDVPFIPNVIWASPDCATYSVLACWKHRNGITPKSDYAKKCDSVNQHMITCIKKWLLLNPKMIFYIENPRGMMRKMPWIQEFKRHTVWYCQYGHNTAKPTDIWTNNLNWVPRPCCKNGNILCHHEPASRGSKSGTQNGSSSFTRSKIPNQLCFEILDAVKY